MDRRVVDGGDEGPHAGPLSLEGVLDRLHVAAYLLRGEPALVALKLRKKTGASLIAVYRGERALQTRPEFQPLPSDVLVLLGEREHLEPPPTT
jgi:uncharacterized protein with PhoU and TrkA domain